jgi:uncharacterized protein
MRHLILDQFFEITNLSGTLAYDSNESTVNVHLHISLSDENGQCLGGHLLTGSIVWTTAEVTLLESIHQRFSRKPDDVTGFRELVVGAA